MTQMPPHKGRRPWRLLQPPLSLQASPYPSGRWVCRARPPGHGERPGRESWQQPVQGTTASGRGQACRGPASPALFPGTAARARRGPGHRLLPPLQAGLGKGGHNGPFLSCCLRQSGLEYLNSRIFTDCKAGEDDLRKEPVRCIIR